jgi:ribokinase
MYDVLVCGSLNMDWVARVAHLPCPGETVAGTSLQRLPGGKGLNQAIAAARLGARTAIIGACGDDADGAALLATLAHEQVDHSRVQRRSECATGLAQVLVADSGENAIVVHSAANGTLRIAELDWAPTRVALAQLETPSATVAEFLRVEREHGAVTLLNPAPALPQTRALFVHADVIVLNETELAYYTQSAAHTPQAYGELARRLCDRDGQTVIVTLGAAGAVAATRHTFHHEAAPAVQVVDTTGAGDCFCGALAATLAQGSDIRAALPRAVRAASLAVTRVGAAPAMPHVFELE